MDNLMQVGHCNLASPLHPAVSQIRTGPMGAAMLESRPQVALHKMIKMNDLYDI